MYYEDRVTKEYVEGLLAGGLQIATGSYVGTGEYGAAHPNTLTFDFVPKLVIVSSDNGLRPTSNGVWSRSLIWFPGSTTIAVCDATTTSNQMKQNGTSLSWYTSNVGCQLNNNGTRYYYFAIG